MVVGNTVYSRVSAVADAGVTLSKALLGNQLLAIDRTAAGAFYITVPSSTLKKANSFKITLYFDDPTNVPILTPSAPTWESGGSSRAGCSP